VVHRGRHLGHRLHLAPSVATRPGASASRKQRHPELTRNRSLVPAIPVRPSHSFGMVGADANSPCSKAAGRGVTHALENHRVKTPPDRGCLRILLTDLLTTAVDGTGCNWTPATNAALTSRPVRQQQTGLDGRDLARIRRLGFESLRARHVSAGQGPDSRAIEALHCCPGSVLSQFLTALGDLVNLGQCDPAPL
jgi:hypothetical protein